MLIHYCYLFQKNKPVESISTTTCIVSSTQIDPDDLCFVVTLSGGQEPQTLTFKMQASKRYVCHVFYDRKGYNWWDIILAFCFENQLKVSQKVITKLRFSYFEKLILHEDQGKFTLTGV